MENHFATFKTTTDSGKNYQWIFKLPGKVRKGIGYLLKLLNNYKEEKTLRVEHFGRYTVFKVSIINNWMKHSHRHPDMILQKDYIIYVVLFQNAQPELPKLKSALGREKKL